MSLAWGPVPVAADTADVAAVAAHNTLRLMGLMVSESAGTAAAAEVIIRHGTTASAPKVTPPLNLTADGTSPPFSFGAGGIPCPNGIFVDRVSGNTELVLYVQYL